MSTLLNFLNSAVAHEDNKRKFFNILGNPASSIEERANAYNGLMSVANHQDWGWLMSQFEQNPGELNSRVMDSFFSGAAQHYRERLDKFVSAEDGVVAISVKAISGFTDFAGAAIFFVHRALTAMETLNMAEELKAFAQFVVLACESKADCGLVPRKLFEGRLKQYLRADVVDDQEFRFKQLVARKRPTNGNDRPRKESEGSRPRTSLSPEKHVKPGDLQKDELINEEGRARAARLSGGPEARANHALAGLGTLMSEPAAETVASA